MLTGRKWRDRLEWISSMTSRLERRPLLKRLSGVSFFHLAFDSSVARISSSSRCMGSTARPGPHSGHLDSSGGLDGTVDPKSTNFVSLEIVTTLRSSRQVLEKRIHGDSSSSRPLHPSVGIRVSPPAWRPKLNLVPQSPQCSSSFQKKSVYDLRTAPFSVIFADGDIGLSLNEHKPRQGYSNGSASGFPEGRQMCPERGLRSRETRSTWKPLRGPALVDHICDILNGPRKWDHLSLINIKLDTYHVGEVLKRQDDTGVALSFFHWAAGQAGFQHNLFTYHIIIRILTLSRNFEQALRLVNEMCHAGCKPDVVTFTILISGFGAANRLGPALEVAKYMREVGCMPNVVTYNVLINIQARLGLHDEALNLFRQMQREGVQSNAATYSSIINCLGKAGLITAATQLFAEMKESCCIPDLITYTTIIDLHSKAGLYQEAIKYYRQMEEAGLKPDIVILCAVMDCLGKAGDVNGSNRIFEELKDRGYSPDAVAYTNIIDINAKSGLYEEAVQLFNEMRQMGVQPNTVNYNSIFDCLGKAGNVSAAYMLFQEMKTLGCVPDLNTYSMMMCLHARFGLQDTCWQLFEEVQQAGLQPSATILIAMIDCLGKVGNFDMALHLFSEIKLRGYPLDVVCYTRMIDICAKCGHYDKSMEFYREMQKSGLEPSIFTYNALIHCFGKSGDPAAAHNLFCEMQRRGCKPNIVTYNTLMDLYSKAGKPQVSLELFTKLELDGIPPDSVTFITMMEALSKAGHPAEAEFMFKKMEEYGHVKRPAYNILIDAWGKTGNVVKVDHWYDQLLNSGLTPDDVTAKTLIVAYLRAHRYDLVRYTIETLSTSCLPADSSVAAILLQHCSALDQKDHVDAMMTLMENLEHPAYAFVHKLLAVNSDDVQADCRKFFNSLHGEERESKMMFVDALVWFLHSQERNVEAGYVWDYAMASDFFPHAVDIRKAPSHWAMNFHNMSVGTAVVALTRILQNFRDIVVEMDVVPDQVSIITGWGRGSKVPGCSTLKQTVQEKLDALGSPFHVDEMNLGCFICNGDSFAKWVRHL